jgi:uncharacterized protein YdhG (YjbR/CyaY superfamily)
MKKSSKFTSVDAYLAAAAKDARPVLKKIRAIVKSVAPQALETISYQVPAFRQGRVFIYFAAFKAHVGVYPPVKGSAALEKALQPYRGEKGNLKFPLDQPVPYALIKRVAIALKRQYAK